jgi:pimeloyl-ACP methyl ester carboxylesterase
MGKLKAWTMEVSQFFNYAHNLGNVLIRQGKKHIGLKKHRTLELVLKEAKKITGHGRCNLIGHSYGGLAALVYTLEKPLNVASCMTIAAPINGTNKAYLIKLVPLKSAQQMMPGNKFVKAVQAYFKSHIKEYSNIIFTNIIAANDSLVSRKDASIKHLAEEEDNVTEYVLRGEGHGSLAYSGFVRNKIIGILENSELPIIFLHGFAMDKVFFKKTIRKIKKDRLDLIQRNNYRIFHFTHDMAVPLKAKKIQEWYDYRHDEEILQKNLLSF